MDTSNDLSRRYEQLNEIGASLSNEQNIDRLLESILLAAKAITDRAAQNRAQGHRKKKNSTVKFNINDDVNHPKFGKGTIEHIEQLEGSVRLHVRFGEDLKKIDQKWLLQAGLKKAGPDSNYIL